MVDFDFDLQSLQEARNLARQGEIAQKAISVFDDLQIEKIILNIVKTAEENAEILASMAVKETGFGNITDKTTKNQVASTLLYQSIKDMKTVGVIKKDDVKKIVEIAEPVGLLMGIVPSTNPTATVIFKSIIAIKSRNGIVFSPHPSALNSTLAAAKLMNEAAVAVGAPQNIVGCVSKPSMASTNELMKCPEVAMIIATGGSAMVKAAYSAGKPALGVGPGNVPAFIEKTADIKKAVSDIIQSKTFDFGTICASEQSVIVEESIREQVMEEFRKQGGYFMTAGESDKVCKALFNKGFAMNAKMVGRSPQYIAEKVGIKIPDGTRVLLGEQKSVGAESPLSYEKLTTVLAFYTVSDWLSACELCIDLLNNGGVGHSLSIHSKDDEMIMRFAEKPVFRILVNTPSTHGGVGLTTGLSPSFTLGCGTWGGSATSDNVTPMHLINIKRVAYFNGEKSKETESDQKHDNLAKIIAKVIKEFGDAIPLGISNRHVHLSQNDVELLFGKGYELTKFKDLSQTGQFACNETVCICGKKGTIENVRILGPVRKETQVEILQADSFKLGVDAPIRHSGEILGTPGVILKSVSGSVELTKGVIVANRHIHMTGNDAKRLNVSDGQLVSLKFDSVRGGSFDNVLIRVDEKSKLECHLDIEEANAMYLNSGSLIFLSTRE